MYFITKLGSVYEETHRIRYDGTTFLRGDYTLFVNIPTFKKIEKIMKVENNFNQRVQLSVINNTLCIVVYNTKTKKTIDEKCKVVGDENINLQPQIDLIPIEIADGWFHIGHQIISVYDT